MSHSVKPLKRFALAAFAAAILCVGPGSSVASAAAWNPAGTIRQQGILEFAVPNKKAPVKCTIVVEGPADKYGFFNPPLPPAQSLCSNGKTIQFSLKQTAEGGGSSFYVNIHQLPGAILTSPWAGSWTQGWAWGVPFTNGSVSTSSQITFSNTVVGSYYEFGSFVGPVTATGVLKVSTPTGGLVTLK